MACGVKWTATSPPTTLLYKKKKSLAAMHLPTLARPETNVGSCMLGSDNHRQSPRPSQHRTAPHTTRHNTTPYHTAPHPIHTITITITTWHRIATHATPHHTAPHHGNGVD